MESQGLTLETAAHEGDAEGPVAADEIREPLARKVLDALLADADRCEGTLQRADIDRAYVKRGLSIRECAWVERELQAQEITVSDSDDDDLEEEDKTEEDASLSFAKASRKARYLSETEERDCGRRIQLAARLTDNDRTENPTYTAALVEDAQRAKDRLVKTNLRYVMKIAKELGPRQHLTLEDLYQEGVIGLIRATELYDPNLGFRFKTYATWWIRQRIHRSIADRERTIRLPVHLQETIRRIQRAQRRIQWETGCPASVSELARTLGVPDDYMAKLLWRVQETNCVEADAPIGDDDHTRLDLQPDRDSASPFDDLADEQLHDKLNELLVKTLTPREERVVRLRFGLESNQEKTLEQIGQDFGLTRERIRQIEASALRKLRHPTRLRQIASFR